MWSFLRWIGISMGLLMILLSGLLGKSRAETAYHVVGIYDYEGIQQYSVVGQHLNETNMDGSQLIYLNNDPNWLIIRVNIHQDNCYLARIQTDGTLLNKLTSLSCDGYLKVSPHAEWIFFYDYEQAALVRPDDTDYRILPDYADTHFDRFVDWQPNDVKFTYETTSPTRWIVVDVSTMTQTQLASELTLASVNYWSPDGTVRIFASWLDGDIDLYHLRQDGTEPLNLTQNSTEDGFIGWSPDNQFILFWSDTGGARSIYRVNLDGTGLQLLSSEKQFTDYFGWSLDGQWFYIKSGWDIWRIRDDGSAEEQLTDEIIVFNQPSWSADNDWIYFIGANENPPSRDNRQRYVYRMEVDGRQIETISDSVGYSPQLLNWSPDKRWLAMTGSRDVIIVSADGHSQTKINFALHPTFLAWDTIHAHLSSSTHWVGGLGLFFASIIFTNVES